MLLALLATCSSSRVRDAIPPLLLDVAPAFAVSLATYPIALGAPCVRDFGLVERRGRYGTGQRPSAVATLPFWRDKLPFSS